MFITALLVALLVAGPALAQQNAAPSDDKARATVEQAIRALGGEKFLKVREIYYRGNYYFWRKGQSSLPLPFVQYIRLPDKLYQELGEKKRKRISVYNLDKNEGWIIEGRDLREANQQEMDDFKRGVKHTIENLLRGRPNEPGVKLFYYGEDSVSWKQRAEAVELVDAENDSVVIFFDVSTRYPIKIEYQEPDEKTGRRVKIEEEFSNWHSVDGVLTPFRTDIYHDGELTVQAFYDPDGVAYNIGLPDELFAKPSLDEKQRKKLLDRIRIPRR